MGSSREVHLRRALRAEGFRDDEVRRLVRAGDLTAVRRGAYVIGTPPEESEVRHALLVQAEVEHLGRDAVVSHVSAAVLHGLPVWGIGLEQVHVTRGRRNGGRCARQIHVHSAPLAEHEIDLIEGIPVTSVARTLVDLARTAPFPQAVAVADAALHRVWREPGQLAALQIQLAAAVGRATGWPGVPAARRVIGFTDGASESVGESRSRVAIARAGLPTPVTQWEVCGSDRRLIGRADFGWPELRAVGEFDGKVKYGRLLRPGQDVADVVYKEKLREDRIRAQDLAVIRWTWPDLHDFTGTAAAIRGRFRRK